MNQPTLVSSTDRRSQIDIIPTEKSKRPSLPRPYSTNFPLSYNLTLGNFQRMSKTNSDTITSHPYGRLSDCYTPSAAVDASSVRAPRRIESPYGQFPTAIPLTTEPIYANTQSLYDNILFPQSTNSESSRMFNRNLQSLNEQQKKSCASQTQLTWTMATFSSFVDLENQSVIIPQPDPTTLYSIVQHFHKEPPPSASPETIEQFRRLSPDVIDQMFA